MPEEKETKLTLDEETLGKLTTTLASDVDLYNKVINTLQEKESEIQRAKQELEETKSKLQQAEERGQQYLGQISNLLSKIPVGNAETPKTMEQKIEEIKNRAWTR